MKQTNTNVSLHEYYVIRVERHLTAEQPELARRDIFVGQQANLTSIKHARQFDSIEHAEDYINSIGAQDRYQFIIQFCTRHKQSEADDPLTNLLQAMMDIPYPYRRTAYNWVRGKDVKQILLRDSQEVYERHCKVLLEHDIDITKKSDLILFKPKRQGKIRINNPDSVTAPRQYFAYPAQRPLPLKTDSGKKS